MPITVYSADIVVPVTAPAVHNGAVAVQGGRILHVGTREWVLGTLQGVDHAGHGGALARCAPARPGERAHPPAVHRHGARRGSSSTPASRTGGPASTPSTRPAATTGAAPRPRERSSPSPPGSPASPTWSPTSRPSGRCTAPGCAASSTGRSSAGPTTGGAQRASPGWRPNSTASPPRRRSASPRTPRTPSTPSHCSTCPTSPAVAARGCTSTWVSPRRKEGPLTGPAGRDLAQRRRGELPGAAAGRLRRQRHRLRRPARRARPRLPHRPRHLPQRPRPLPAAGPHHGGRAVPAFERRHRPRRAPGRRLPHRGQPRGRRHRLAGVLPVARPARRRREPCTTSPAGRATARATSRPGCCGPRRSAARSRSAWPPGPTASASCRWARWPTWRSSTSPAATVRDAIENVATDGAGRVAATLLGGEVRWAGPAWADRADQVSAGVVSMPERDVPALAAELGMEPHPEGGWFVRTWAGGADGGDPDGTRPTATLIHFLLPAGEVSAWHAVVSDEVWLWHGPGRARAPAGRHRRGAGRGRPRPHARPRRGWAPGPLPGAGARRHLAADAARHG